MTTTTTTSAHLLTEEQVRYAKSLYEEKLRFELETEENIGKSLWIDVETGEYAVGEGPTVRRNLQGERYGNGMLYGLRIGYKTAETIGGVRERIQR